MTAPISKPSSIKVIAQDGWTPGRSTVQGGYIPTTGQVAAPPPTGGSGVKPPEKK